MTPAEPGQVWTRSREHARVVSKEISDLFARCILDAYLYLDIPSDEDLHTLAFHYGITPFAVRQLIADLGRERRDLDQSVAS